MMVVSLSITFGNAHCIVVSADGDDFVVCRANTCALQYSDDIGKTVLKLM